MTQTPSELAIDKASDIIKLFQKLPEGELVQYHIGSFVAKPGRHQSPGREQTGQVRPARV